MDDFLAAYFGFTCVIGVMALYGISISEYAYDMDYVLSESKEFWKCVFMYQVAVYRFTEDEINVIGIVILELLTTALFCHMNVAIFAMLFVLLTIKYIAKLFYMIFRKRR